MGAVEETGYLFDSKPATNTFNSRSTYTPATANDFDSLYVPSPVVKPVGILKVNNRNNTFYNSTDSIPEYNPTPISWLKNPSNSTTDATPKYDFSNYKLPDSRKKKNTEEYDPTMVKLKSTSKKSVMFADEAGIALDDACAPNFSSSEEDMDDLGSAPKFSDDDLDDYSHAKVDCRQVPKSDAKEETEEEEEVLDEKSIDEFSLVDKILVGSKKSDKLISNFKKSVLTPKERKTKHVKDDKKNVKSKKRKEVNNAYDCEVNDAPSKPTRVSDFDAIMSMASFDDLKDDETIDKDKSSKKVSSKTSELSRTKTSLDLETRKEQSEVSKSKLGSSDKKSKESAHTSKHSEKSTDSKTKMSKHSSSSSDKSKLNSKHDKTEKHKSIASFSSKTDK